ncbi:MULTISPECIES: class I SAM-dependent methyltransferase [Pseudomonas]|uniref:class I SAM-dependent methyltransferase n=1 Tax=Pseudomonas nitroreducens TaxID=46680 RepID=UPI001E33BF85|nr:MULTISPECIES: class I SAM-dependent methyltransferase [Pseudomonas]MCE4068987.1 methyltransferase domain-containing protein [Pseudomonas nitritireducens]MCE4078176.1 methyltransferase domain-containing protein [Pseudomonas nitroreducens]
MSEQQFSPEQPTAEARQAGASADPTLTEELTDLLGRSCGFGKVLSLEPALVAKLLASGQNAFGLVAPGSAMGDRFTPGYATELPFPDEHFETLVSAGQLETLSQDELALALREIRRVTSRYVFLRISTSTEQDENPAIRESRGWWETRCYEAGFRKHPLYYRANPYAALNEDSDQLYILLEKVPIAALQSFDLLVLEEERLLHTDMLRETGRRSDAHCIRYHMAAELIRPGDRVLDVACGLGYGSHILYASSQAHSVIGVDLSDFGIDYANAHYGLPGKLEFLVGDAQALEQIPDNSIDFISAFETIEHVPYPLEYLKALKRVLKPSGRIMVCAPNNWADETGEDPNPHHLHVYTWDRLVKELSHYFLLERGFLQTAGGAMRCHFSPRSWVEVDPGSPLPQDGEWILLVGMADPIAAQEIPYQEVSWKLPASEDFHVSAFARDYTNPWLLRSMVSRGMRANSSQLLSQLQTQTLERAPAESVDFGAALCGSLYSQLSESEGLPKPSQTLEEHAKGYESISEPTPHQLRWQVSLLFVRAETARLSGDWLAAIELYEACASLDVMKYSPLLGNKTLDAFHWLAVLSVSQQNPEKARQYLLRAVREAIRLTSGSWLNVIGLPESPLPFGFSEMAQLMDKASRAAYMLKVLDEEQDKPGLFLGESQGFFERQLSARNEQIRNLEGSTQALLSLVAEQDARLKTLAHEVERLHLRSHELASEVMHQDEHAQALAKEVARQDEHAQSLAREVIRQSEQAQALAQELRQHQAAQPQPTAEYAAEKENHQHTDADEKSVRPTLLKRALNQFMTKKKP